MLPVPFFVMPVAPAPKGSWTTPLIRRSTAAGPRFTVKVRVNPPRLTFVLIVAAPVSASEIAVTFDPAPASNKPFAAPAAPEIEPPVIFSVPFRAKLRPAPVGTLVTLPSVITRLVMVSPKEAMLNTPDLLMVTFAVSMIWLVF